MGDLRSVEGFRGPGPEDQIRLNTLTSLEETLPMYIMGASSSSVGGVEGRSVGLGCNLEEV